MVKLWRGITSLVFTPHIVLTSSKVGKEVRFWQRVGGSKILAKLSSLTATSKRYICSANP